VIEPDVVLVVPQPHHTSVCISVPFRAKIKVLKYKNDKRTLF